MAKQIERIVRGEKIPAEEKAKYDQIRKEAEQEFPPSPSPRQPAETGIAAELHRAREAQGLTWYAVARQAGISANVVRDVECGRNTDLANIEAIAKSLRLKLKLVEA